MPFKYTYDEILEMVKRTVLDTNVARAIVRRSGLRPGGGAGHTAILSICPPGGPCPRRPYPYGVWGKTYEELAIWNATVADAVSGDGAALEAMRIYLIDDFLFTEDAVNEGPATYILDPDAGCIIEVDLTPPAVGGDIFDVVGARQYENNSLAAGTHFFPPDYFDYITQWDLSTATQVRMSVVVEEASSAGVTIFPIWTARGEGGDLLSVQISILDWSPLGTGVAPASSGFYVTDWEDLPLEALEAGEVYICFRVVADSPIEVFKFGLAEVHIR